jgi:hypothetical protein
MLKYDWESHDIKVIFGDLNFRSSSVFAIEKI